MPFALVRYSCSRSVRRGFQVYREVCASCHALEHIYFRNLVGITHTEDEVKKIAESYDIVDGPNAEGVSGRGKSEGVVSRRGAMGFLLPSHVTFHLT